MVLLMAVNEVTTYGNTIFLKTDGNAFLLEASGRGQEQDILQFLEVIVWLYSEVVILTMKS